jgi:hypothetical protein
VISKQDMVAARTPADLERRYNFRKSFGEAMNLATDARKAAEEADRLAQEAAEALKGLDQEEIFRILTNDGEVQGIYRGEDGKIYINASYIAAGELTADLIKFGALSSADGNLEFNLDWSYISSKWASEFTGHSGFMMLSGNQLKFWVRYPELGTSHTVLEIRAPSGIPGNSSGIAEAEIISERNLAIWAVNGLRLGSPTDTVEISGKQIVIGGKTVSWKDNGDGTYTLIGTD